MRVLGAFVVAGLLAVSTLHGQTVRSHSSLRIPTPAIDDSEPTSPSAMRASAGSRSREVPAREASLQRNVASDARSSSELSRPRLVPLNDAALVNTQDASVSARNVSATTALMPISSQPVGTGVQYFGAPAGSSSALRPAVSPAGYASQANYGATASPTATYAQPAIMPSTYPPAASMTPYNVPTSGIAQTSFSQPSYAAPTSVACGGAGTGPVVTGMQPTFPTTAYPATSYPTGSYPAVPYAMGTYPTTVLSPPIGDAASYAPSLNGSTIPGAGYPAPGGGSGAVVPYLINPVAVNIPAVPVDESRLQPIVALRPTVPEESYAGRGILGQPELYVRGQHVRNVLRYITLW